MSDSPTQTTTRPVISVSELNKQAKALLEEGIGHAWVEGEISNLSRPASGHVYFSLKDESSQLRCAWFRGRQRGPTINLADGDQVVVYGAVSIYLARGDYQMIVEQLEPAGEGELRRRFEALKKKLAAEGLFDESEKQYLPELPTRIGVVTSPTGAALRDILSVLGRRFPAIPVVIYPTQVQGEFAAPQIVAAIETAAERDECDVLIVGRGGGSLEDLWPFNEEIVARAIAACPIPVVSAVGHEIDFTIADFVADERAPTPSGAAELVTPDQAEWLRHLQSTSTRIASLGRRFIEERSQAVDWLYGRLTQSSPAATVARQRAWLLNLRQVLAAAIRHDIAQRTIRMQVIRTQLARRSPSTGVQRNLGRLDALQQRLRSAGPARLWRLRSRLQLAARTLESVSPLATLDRGYAIVTEAATGRILTDAANVDEGDRIRAQLASGSLDATVTKKEEANDA